MNKKDKSVVEKIVLLSVLGIITIVLVFQFFQIKILKTQVDNLINGLGHSFNSIGSSINNISSSINDMGSSLEESLVKQNRIISSVEYKYGNLKSDNRTAEIIISVTPKSHTEDTSINIKLGERLLNTTKTDANTFTAIYEADIFECDEEFDFITVTVTSNGVSTTEIVEEFRFNDTALDSIYTGSLVDDYLTFIKFSDDIELDYPHSMRIQGTIYDFLPERIKNARLVVEINGKVYEDVSIDLSEENAYIEKEYKMNPDDSAIAYVVYEDANYGYSYKAYIKTRYAESSTHYEVYDKNGNVIY